VSRHSQEGPHDLVLDARNRTIDRSSPYSESTTFATERTQVEELPSDRYIHEKFDRYYSTLREIPLLNRKDLERAIGQSYHRTSRAVQICVFAILSLEETDRPVPTTHKLDVIPASPSLGSLCRMLNRTLEAANNAAIGLEMVIGSLASYLSFRNLARWDKAWYYLQQAITFAQILELDRIDSYDPVADPKGAICGLKTYYTLCVQWLRARSLSQ
jgi:hypothetical protein